MLLSPTSLVQILFLSLISRATTTARNATGSYETEDIQPTSRPQTKLPIIPWSGTSPSSPKFISKNTPSSRPVTRHASPHFESKAGRGLIQSLLKQTFQRIRNGRGRTAPVLREISYHDGETIATIFTDANGNVTRCSLFEIKRVEDSERILAQFARNKRPVFKISFRTMLSVITACQAIEPHHSKENSLNDSVHFSNMASRQTPDPLSMSSVISGILPGTKWCGIGDIAQDYEDLGKEKDLDKCCRAHDHCPTKLRSFRSGYGLINWSLYTKSHCDCDSLLYECLKKTGGPTAELLGNFYFNVLKVQCIDDENPTRCIKRERNSVCRAWAPDSGAEKKLVFRNVRRQF